MEAIWSAHSTSTRTTESTTTAETTLTDIESSLLELTESMEMRTSRIGKMVHELVGTTNGIKGMLEGGGGGGGGGGRDVGDGGVGRLEGGIKSLSRDVESLLAIAAEQGLAVRVVEEEREVAETARTRVILDGLTGVKDIMEKQAENVKRLIQESVFEKLEKGLSDIVGEERMGNQVASAVQAALEKIQLNTGRAGESEDLLHGKLDNIAEVIDFVNQSQCRLVTLLSEKLRLSSLSPTPSPLRSTKEFDYPRLIESIQDTITEQLEPLVRSHLSKTPEAVATATTTTTDTSVRAMHSLILESLATIDGHISRNARDTSSRQDLTEVWMERNHEVLKQIQQGVQAVEKMERNSSSGGGGVGGGSGSGSPRRGVGTSSGAFCSLEDDRKVDAFARSLEKRATTVMENLVEDLKETITLRQKRVSEDLERLVEEKLGLLGEVEGLRKQKNALEEEVEQLQRIKLDCESVEPISNAVRELEEELMGRVAGLMAQVEKLKKERDGLVSGK
ncbi:hypothetical protein HDU98_008333 [Podochytrium sp. JEL0797]|nr:hypothetical protein HDU98_008333 [Podochytrium sp. JEL0797]